MIYIPVKVRGWKNAYHVYNGPVDDVRSWVSKNRIGIVNRRTIRLNGEIDREMWFAYNKHFFAIKGEFPTRSAAAEAIPKGAIHQDVGAISGH